MELGDFDFFRVRIATLGDVEPLALLTRPPGGNLELARRKLHYDLAERVPPGELLLLVAEAGDQIVGFSRATWVVRPASQPEEIPTGWYLLGLYVAPPHRRRGIGRALTERRLLWLRGRAEQVWFTTMADNGPSIALHRAFGFTEVARGVRAPGQPPDPGRVLFRMDFRD